MGDDRTHIGVLMCHLAVKRPVSTTRYRWIDNVERNGMNLSLEETWTKQAIQTIPGHTDRFG